MRLFAHPPRRWHSSLAVVSETYGWFLHRLGEDAARTFHLALGEWPQLELLIVDVAVPGNRHVGDAVELVGAVGDPEKAVTIHADAMRSQRSTCGNEDRAFSIKPHNPSDLASSILSPAFIGSRRFSGFADAMTLEMTLDEIVFGDRFRGSVLRLSCKGSHREPLA